MSKNLDRVSIRNILSIRYDPEQKIPQAKKHWRDFEPKNPDPGGRRTERLLKDRLRAELGNDEDPIVISLSSGIDSTLCLALARDVFPDRRIVAICGVFRYGFDESKVARVIAEKFDADFRTARIDSMFANMPELISVLRMPKWNTYAHIIAKAAKKFGQRIVTGDGADEIFGGYTFRYGKFLDLSGSRDGWKTKVANYLECHNRDWVPDQESLFASGIGFSWNKIHGYFRPYFSNPLQPLNQLMLADYNGKLLYDFLPTWEAIRRFYGIGYLPLFLRPSIIESGTSLPLAQKYDHKSGLGKLVLRKIAARHGIEHTGVKRGFSPDLLFDWNDGGGGESICERYIMPKDSLIYAKKLVNRDWVMRAFERIRNDGDIRYLNRMISVLALEIWCRIIVEGEMRPDKKLC